MKATLIVIQNDADHAEAKRLIERLMDSNDPADQARIAIQARLVEAYERSRWPHRNSTVPELLTYLMDQHGLTRADLIPLLVTASRVSEVLNGKRELSMSMIRKVRERFRIPADLLISQTPCKDRQTHFPERAASERHVRGKRVCRSCETLIQAPVPPQVIDRGIPTAGLLAHVLVSKFARSPTPLSPGGHPRARRCADPALNARTVERCLWSRALTARAGNEDRAPQLLGVAR